MDPSIPPELLLPAPRTLRRRKNAGIGRVGRFFLTLLALIPVGVLIYSLVEPVLLSRANLIGGTITDLHTTHGSKGSTDYHVAYRYTLDEMTRDDSESVTETLYGRLHVNQTVKIRVIQIGSWSTTRLDLVWQHYAAERWPMWLVGGIFGGVVVLIVIGQARQRELLRSGTATIGRVINKTLSRGRSTSYWINYEFEPDSGPAINKRIAVYRRFYDQTQIGEAVCVLYNPSHPKRAVIYGAASHECVGSRDYGP